MAWERQRPLSKGPEFLEFLARPSTGTCSIRRPMGLEHAQTWQFLQVCKFHCKSWTSVQALRFNILNFDFLTSIRCYRIRNEKSFEKRDVLAKFLLSLLKVFSRIRDVYVPVIVSFAFRISIEANIFVYLVSLQIVPEAKGLNNDIKIRKKEVCEI